MKQMRIPLSEPLFDGNEAKYLLDCLENGWLSTSGPYVDRFESALLTEIGTQHAALATQSGTAALHLALRALGIGEGDAVAVSSLSFIAPANAIRYVGALPIFVDAEPTHAQMDVVRLEELLEDECSKTSRGWMHRASGRILRAVLPVHLLGHPADLPAIVELADRFGLDVIEDAAEAVGATLAGQAAGTFGRVGCFSFNGNKTISAGGGGAIVSRDRALIAKARHLATQAKADAAGFVHDEVGYNYRMTALHASVGCAQLEQLALRVQQKRAIRDLYRSGLATTPGVTCFEEAEGAYESAWLVSARIDSECYGQTASDLLALLRRREVEARALWQPLHQSPAHVGVPSIGGEVAEALHRDVVCFPSSPGLTPADVERVVELIDSGAR